MPKSKAAKYHDMLHLLMYLFTIASLVPNKSQSCVRCTSFLLKAQSAKHPLQISWYRASELVGWAAYRVCIQSNDQGFMLHSLSSDLDMGRRILASVASYSQSLTLPISIAPLPTILEETIFMGTYEIFYMFAS